MYMCIYVCVYMSTGIHGSMDMNECMNVYICLCIINLSIYIYIYLVSIYN